STGFIAHNPNSKEIFVVYRGSYTLEDWLEDFTFIQVPSPIPVPGSLMHTGFLTAYRANHRQVKDTLEKLLATYPDYTLIVSGHSLGGGEAAVAATDFAITKPAWIPRMKLITFGQPRVGNIVHAKWLSQQKFPIFRVVNRGDPVPHVPTIAMNYYHEAQQVWYDLSGKVNFCGRDGDSSTCSDSVPLSKWSWNQHNEYPGL
ncbi:alpha/beta-hydrolase, partial [Linderina pennispora]